MLKATDLSKMNMSELTNAEMLEVNGGGLLDSLFYYAGAIIHMAYKDACDPNYHQDAGSAAMNSAF